MNTQLLLVSVCLLIERLTKDTFNSQAPPPPLELDDGERALKDIVSSPGVGGLASFRDKMGARWFY